MPTILRNPFRKQDENLRPDLRPSSQLKTSGTSSPKPIEIPEKEQPAEYKLSEINDSGVFVPPSPPERKSFWSTASSRSTTSTNHRSLLNGDEQFGISRESFDSYRRSFDISARSPIIQPYENGRPRASLDSRTFLPPAPRSSNSFTRPTPVPVHTREEDTHQDGAQDVAFEDVDIADKPAPQQKKKGLFSRIADYGDHSDRPISQDGKKESSWHHFGGRKRGQSGQGAELGAIPKRETTPKPESQLKHGKNHSIDSPASKQSKDTPKAERPKDAKPSEAQVTAGAPQEESAKVDSAVDVNAPTSGLKEISLEDAPQTDSKVPEVRNGATPEVQKQDEGLKALQSQNAQAPEIKVDS